MGKFWMKIWLGTKVFVFGLIAFYLLIFVLFNLHNDAIVWYALNREVKTNTLALACCAFIAGVVCTVLIRTVVVTLKQFREVKERNRRDKLMRDVEELKAQAPIPPETSIPLGDSDVKT